MTLYEMTHSPFCIPVRRILDAHGIEYERVEIPAWDRRELARTTNGAYYQVPILEHNGQIVFETAGDPLAVAHFLNSEIEGANLFPSPCAGIQEIVIADIENRLEAFGFKLSDPFYVDSVEDVGERTMIIRHKERKFGTGCVDAWRRDQEELSEEFEKALAPYELRLSHSDWLFGDAPVYADYALFGVLGNFQFGGHHALSPEFSALKAWETRMKNYSAE